jgi:hypothetical protein
MASFILAEALIIQRILLPVFPLIRELVQDLDLMEAIQALLTGFILLIMLTLLFIRTLICVFSRDKNVMEKQEYFASWNG